MNLQEEIRAAVLLVPLNCLPGRGTVMNQPYDISRVFRDECPQTPTPLFSSL